MIESVMVPRHDPCGRFGAEREGGDSMRIRWGFVCGTVTGLAIPATAILATAALGSETTTYSYDALGRLVSSTQSGGPSTGLNMATCFDRAGNRLRYDTVTTAPAACPTPTPTPTPG